MTMRRPHRRRRPLPSLHPRRLRLRSLVAAGTAAKSKTTRTPWRQIAGSDAALRPAEIQRRSRLQRHRTRHLPLAGRRGRDPDTAAAGEAAELRAAARRHRRRSISSSTALPGPRTATSAFSCCKARTSLSPAKATLWTAVIRSCISVPTPSTWKTCLPTTARRCRSPQDDSQYARMVVHLSVPCPAASATAAICCWPSC